MPSRYDLPVKIRTKILTNVWSFVPQILSQIMKLSYFPQIKIVHVSKNYYGQVYIPFANWLLMIGTVIVTAVYTNVRNPVLVVDPLIALGTS